MKKHLCLWLCLLVSGLLVSSAAEAGSAGLLVSPTRVIFENGERYETVIVKNDGDATGRYKLEVVDASMTENGTISILENGVKDEFSAADLISISPRSITLKPNDNQSVRLLIKNKPDLPDGEYRSHLRVRMTENDLDAVTNKPAEGAGIQIKAKITTVIPLIIRKGKTSYAFTIDDAKLVMGGSEGQQMPEVKVVMSFTGNRSLVSDMKVTHIGSDGQENEVGFFRGLVIYRGVVKRTQSVTLKVPEGVNIYSGKLRVDVLSQQNEGSHVLSEKEITP